MSRTSLASYDNHAAAQRLRALIDARWQGSDRAFAEAIGIDPVTLSRLVNGHSDLRKSPSVTRIAEAFRISEARLVYGHDDEQDREEGSGEAFSTAVRDVYRPGDVARAAIDAVDHIDAVRRRLGLPEDRRKAIRGVDVGLVADARDGGDWTELDEQLWSSFKRGAGYDAGSR